MLIKALEEALLQLSTSIRMIEDYGDDKLAKLEAKRVFLIAMLKQLDIELEILNQEYDESGYDIEEEMTTLKLFEDSRNAYNDIMSNLFKPKH